MKVATNGKYVRRQERRAITVEAVLKLAAHKNPASITTAEIADEMQVTQGALFRHFPSKDALWQSVMEWVTAELLRRIEVARQLGGLPSETMEAIFLAHIVFVMEHPGAPRIMLAELQRPDATAAKAIVQQTLNHYREQVKDVLLSGIATREFHAELHVEAASVMFVSMAQGLVMQSFIAGDNAMMENYAHSLFTIYAKGIKRND